MTSRHGKQTLTIQILPNISRGKDNYTMKFGQLIEYPTNIYLFQVNNRDIRKRGETCLKLTIKSLIVNFEHI